MKLHAVPTQVPSRGCQYTGKTFHRWVLSFIDPRGSECQDLERKCVDCGVRHSAMGVPNHDTRELPRALWCLGDWTWHEGGLEP